MDERTRKNPEIASRAEAILADDESRIFKSVDRLFATLILFQWTVAVGAALWMSPDQANVSGRLITTVLNGGVIALLPLVMVSIAPGKPFTRHLVASGQMLMAALLVSLVDGRIETRFEIFGALAFLSLYRDWRVLVTASIVTLGDQFMGGGILWTQSVNGLAPIEPLRCLEQIGCVLLTDFFLFVSIWQSREEMTLIADRHAKLESANKKIEHEVAERTAEVRTGEEIFRSLSGASPVGIFLDSCGACIYANQRLGEIYDVSSDDLIGKGWIHNIHPDDRPQIEKEGLAALRENREIGLEYRIVTPSGAIRWVSTRAARLPSDDGQTVFVGTVDDITERKRLEQQLALGRDEALETARLKSEFLSNMSHEIRTPLNGIIGMTGLLVDSKLTNEQREFAETVRTSGDALLTIVNDILDFSKIAAGKLVFEEIDFDLLSIAESTIELLADQACKKKIELALRIDPSVPLSVRGDPGRLRQVLTNLVGNAVKFTAQGEVVLTISAESVSDDEARLLFHVRDTGIGIEPEAQRRLFQAFSQADSSTSRKYGGTGLGLAISMQLVEAMGGKIEIESEVGRGTTFHFAVRLPRSVSAATHLPKLKGLRALIVDDNTTSRDILDSQLTAWEVECHTVESGTMALVTLRDQVSSRPFDLVLIDSEMPQMDGLTLGREIREDPRIAETRIVLMTSAGERGDIAARAINFDNWINKPIKLAKLHAALIGLANGQEAPYQDADRTASSAERPREIAVSAAAPDRVNVQSKKLRILVAEDNTVNQKIALLQLKKLGFVADAVGNGAEAVEALERVPYQVVLMDCQMPEMDGYTASAEIRRRHAGKPGPVIIAMTAHAMQGDREKCLSAGMDDYIAKPVKIDEVEAALTRWMSKALESDSSPNAAALAA
jgi:two-component system sensor histidine kinase/response regulator